MALYDVTRDELQGMLAQLEEAFHNHKEWHSALTRILICKLPGDKHDTSPKAHRECRFGQWYYGGVPDKLRCMPGFIAMGEAHLRMHKLAAELLIAAGADRHMTSLEFDAFVNALQRLQLEIVALQRELEDALHNHDSLTGAINRFGILPTLREQQELVKRRAQVCCIVMVDLNNLKAINERHGHLAGDLALAGTAHYLIDSVRPYDKLFRYGGDEFLLCLQHTALESAVDMMKRLGEGLAATSIEIGGNQLISLSASFGVALLEADIPVESSIDRADKAMYAAKAAKGDGVQMWSPEM